MTLVSNLIQSMDCESFTEYFMCCMAVKFDPLTRKFSFSFVSEANNTILRKRYLFSLPCEMENEVRGKDNMKRKMQRLKSANSSADILNTFSKM